MKTHPLIDREFIHASPFLKRILDEFKKDLEVQDCLDIPAGNGRNTFLLAAHFKKVTAIDINDQYLTAIERNKGAYLNSKRISTVQADILKDIPIQTDAHDFICNIHFYDEALTGQLIKEMKKGALLLLETPGCQGENYKILPAEKDLDGALQGCEILIKEFRSCPHQSNGDKKGALKMLIRKC